MKCEVCGHKITLVDETCPSCGHRINMDNQKYQAIDHLKTNLIKFNGRKFSADFKMSRSSTFMFVLIGIWVIIFISMVIQLFQ